MLWRMCVHHITLYNRLCGPLLVSLRHNHIDSSTIKWESACIWIPHVLYNKLGWHVSAFGRAVKLSWRACMHHIALYYKLDWLMVNACRNHIGGGTIMGSVYDHHHALYNRLGGSMREPLWHNTTVLTMKITERAYMCMCICHFVLCNKLGGPDPGRLWHNTTIPMAEPLWWLCVYGHQPALYNR